MTTREETAAVKNEKIEKMLQGLFEQVEEQFLFEQVAAYRAQADREFNRFHALVHDDGPAKKAGWGEGSPYAKPYYVKGDYKNVELPFECSVGCHSNPERQRNQERIKFDLGYYSEDYAKAEKDARDMVAAAKAAFVSKLGKKIGSAVGERRVANVKGSMRLDLGVVICDLDVEMVGGDRFSLEQKVITNYRYQPRFLAFYQFPARFSAIEVGGKKHKSESEAWMTEHFAGKGQPAPKPAKAARYEVRYVAKDRCTPFRVIDLETGKTANGGYACYRSQAPATRVKNQLEAAHQAA